MQLGERFAVGLAELLGDRGLHHRQRLPNLHRTALELTEHGEQLIGGLLHQLGVDLIPGLAGQPFAEPQRCPAREANRDAGQLRVARRAAPFDVCHRSIIHDGCPGDRIDPATTDVNTNTRGAWASAAPQ